MSESIIMYRTQKLSPEIQQAEFDRVTKQYGFRNKRRYKLRSDYVNYFASFEEAKQFLLDECRQEYDRLQKRLDMMNARRRRLVRLTPDDSRPMTFIL